MTYYEERIEELQATIFSHIARRSMDYEPYEIWKSRGKRKASPSSHGALNTEAAMPLNEEANASNASLPTSVTSIPATNSDKVTVTTPVLDDAAASEATEEQLRSQKPPILDDKTKLRRRRTSPMASTAAGTVANGTILKFSARHWEAKMNYLNLELRKSQTYLDALRKGLPPKSLPKLRVGPLASGAGDWPSTVRSGDSSFLGMGSSLANDEDVSSTPRRPSELEQCRGGPSLSAITHDLATVTLDGPALNDSNMVAHQRRKSLGMAVATSPVLPAVHEASLCDDASLGDDKVKESKSNMEAASSSS